MLKTWVLILLLLTTPALCLSATIAPSEKAFQNDYLTIHFIDVGHGDATLVNCPNGKSILIDAGSSSGFPGGKLRYYLLKHGGIAGKTLEALIITRPDTNSYNLVSRALDKVPVKKLYLAGTEDQYSGAKFENWLKNIDQDRKIFLSRADFHAAEFPFSEISCGDTQIHMLATQGASDRLTEDIVLMIRYGDFSAILSGGGASAMEESSPDRFSSDWPPADILKIGSNARLTAATLDTLADSTKPQAVVVSAGSQNNYAWHAFSQNAKAIYSTATQGNLVVKSDGNSFKIFPNTGK